MKSRISVGLYAAKNKEEEEDDEATAAATGYRNLLSYGDVLGLIIGSLN